MAEMSPASSGIDRPPFGQTASGLVFAGRSSPGWGGDLGAPFASANRAVRRRRTAHLSTELHENESVRRNRFISLVGRKSAAERLCCHAHSTLPPLCRTHGRSPQHGSLLCHDDRAESVRRGMPDTPLGPDRCAWPDEGPAFCQRARRRRCLPRSSPTEAKPRISCHPLRSSSLTVGDHLRPLARVHTSTMMKQEL